jgi:hypothetical protein
VKRFELKETKRRRKQQTVNSKQHSAYPQSEIRNPKSVLGFRVFRPPLQAIVQAEHGYPRQISAWDKNRSVYGKVIFVAGPWRTSGDWWRADTWARDEWDVAVQSGGQRSEIRDQKSDGSKAKEICEPVSPPLQVLYRIYRELRSGSWFVEGIYD